MTQELLDLGPPPSPVRPAAGTWITADRRPLGRSSYRIRGVHATAVTADRVEVIANALDRGELTPRTKPTTIAYGDFTVVEEATPMPNRNSELEETAALAVRCVHCGAAAGRSCIGQQGVERDRRSHPERIAEGHRGLVRGLTDPPPIDVTEIREAVAGIRESLERSTSNTARGNIVRRLRSLESRLTS